MDGAFRVLFTMALPNLGGIVDPGASKFEEADKSMGIIPGQIWSLLTLLQVPLILGDSHSCQL